MNAPSSHLMRITSSLVLFFLLASCASHTRRPSSEILSSNQLRPFTSDGCSRFPDGIPLVNAKKWQHCCIYHDVAYWQGGTLEQRLAADQELRACVARTGEAAIADAMFIGVRAGGAAALPTSWKWGYGWVLSRGYQELNAEELELVSRLTPQDPLQTPVVRAPTIPVRETLTGDYCLDEAIVKMHFVYGQSFRILDATWSEAPSAEGTLRTYKVATSVCAEPSSFEFLLLKKETCTTPSSELLLRGRMRLLNSYLCQN